MFHYLLLNSNQPVIAPYLEPHDQHLKLSFNIVLPFTRVAFEICLLLKFLSQIL
jgi:hypothetical protein